MTPRSGTRAIRQHRRFTLRDVTLGGLPVGGATIDEWRDGDDRTRWSARLLIPVEHPVEAGLLAGTVSGGERLSGAVRPGQVVAGPRRGGVLVELHGDGPLGPETGPAAGPERSAPH